MLSFAVPAMRLPPKSVARHIGHTPYPPICSLFLIFVANQGAPIEKRAIVKQIARWAGAPDDSSFINQVAPAPPRRKV